MDVETYDQIDLPKDEVGDALKFVKRMRCAKYVHIKEMYLPLSHLFCRT